jgi:trans-2,3-dihydro-3-hydroxyanthranilate isomerase
MPSVLTPHAIRYRVVDVFSKEALLGNPLAVFPNATGLDDVTMQKIAKELNLSETVFIGPATRPDCAASVRIFTPAREMRFAGHPTVGAAHVLFEMEAVPKGTDRMVLEEKVGPVPVRVESNGTGRSKIWLTTPPIRFGRSLDRELCARALGLNMSELLDIPPEIVSAGNPGAFVAVKSKDAVDSVAVDPSALRKLEEDERAALLLFVFAPTKEGAYSRMFARGGMLEDPATGSATGPLAAYMMRHGLAPTADGTSLISEQGTKMGRRSILHILIHGEEGAGGIEVGGYVTPVIEGVMTLALARTARSL